MKKKNENLQIQEFFEKKMEKKQNKRNVFLLSFFTIKNKNNMEDEQTENDSRK